jgi:RHS repeat-associated protein
VTVGGQTTQFFYDGDGNLAKKVKPDGSKTFYTGMYEVDKSSGGTVTKIAVYYPVGGAMRINGTLYFILKDHLGSSSVVTDARGTTVGEDRFYPYGETRFTTGTMYTDKLYTGQREMTGLGIYHYGARFYSPKLGRFLSPDTIVPGMANPQALNRYSYVLGNPLRYTDPTGHYCVGDDEDCVHDDGGTSNSQPTPAPSNTPTPTNTPTSTPSPTPTSTPTPASTSTPIPTPTGSPTSIQTAISYLQDSPLGLSLYNVMIAEGYTVQYSATNAGHLDEVNKIIYVSPTESPTYIAGSIAHEAMHYDNPGAGSLREEYMAYFVGDSVRNDIIQSGHGNSSDMIKPLSAYNVNIFNSNNAQLSQDLKSWFRGNGLGDYVDRWHVPSLFIPRPNR